MQFQIVTGSWVLVVLVTNMLISKNTQLVNKGRVNIQVDKFDGGSNSLYSENRLKKNQSKESLNLMLIEDGVWDKRWGTDVYPRDSEDFTNRPDGFTEYRKTDGTRELIVVADGKVWRQLENGTRAEITGATFTSGFPIDSVQIGNVLYICNGEDNLARYDGSTLSTYSAITLPAWASTELARGAGLSSGAYTYYYRVSAINAVGETVPNATESIGVDIRRGLWDEADEYIVVDWEESVGATGYIVYLGEAAGYETKLAEVAAGVTTFTDDGSLVANPYIDPPTENTTGAPKFSTITLSGNRIWGTKDPDQPWRAYWSGTGVNIGDFTSNGGGGWVDLEKGGRSTNTRVLEFQGKTHVICKTDDGRGSVWQLTFDTIVIGETTITVPVPLKIVSSIGSSSPRSAAYVENDVFFFNKKGEFILGNEPGVLNVLRTNELSSNIRPYIRLLNEENIDKVCSYYYDGKVLISVPTLDGYPNRTIVFDRERNAWLQDWSIGVSQFGEYTDSNGVTKLLGIADKNIIEFSPNYEGDLGSAFTWRYLSPRFPVAEDWSLFSWIMEVVANFRSVSGECTLTIFGTDRYDVYKEVGSFTIIGQNTTVNSGMGWDKLANFLLGSTSSTYTPQVLADRLIKRKPINKKLRDIQIQIEGTGMSDRAVILGYIINGFRDQAQKPLRWQN